MEVLEDRLAARLEPESLVVRLQNLVVAHAVEPEELATGRRDLGLGPIQQTLAQPQPRVRPPHRDRVDVPGDRRLLAPEVRIAPEQRERRRWLAAHPREVELAAVQ